jgi:hypothetical protein
MADTIGDTMKKSSDQAFKSLAIGAGIVVYAGMLLYSGVHNLNLMTRGVAEEMRIWGILGMVALEISAAALPVALHFWTHEPGQRMAAFAFYGLDLGLILLNVVLDFALTAGEALPAWLNVYLFYGAPVTPIIAGLGWSVLLLMDPAQRQRAMIETLRASTMKVLSGKISEAARAADVTLQVDQAAAEMTRSIVADALGIQTSAVRPFNSKSNGHKPAIYLNAETEASGEMIPFDNHKEKK